MSGCPEFGGIVLVQLRPDDAGLPLVVAVAICPEHFEACRAYMIETWPTDPIRMTSYDNWVKELPLWREVGQRAELLHA
jgi:hypothetical protein